MTPDESFEKLWGAAPFNPLVRGIAKQFYLAGDTDATKRTAQRCVEICRAKKSTANGRAWIEIAAEECADAIEKEFGL